MKPHYQTFRVLGSLSLLALVAASPTQAQVVPDATLPNPSLVTSSNNTSVITGGTQAGSNLFHSFREFSVLNSGSASFQEIDQGIQNVLTRVTGSEASNIDGPIEVLQTNGNLSSANLFFLNPNGIVFGPNASLNLGGSFLASTASSLSFADGTSFSATVPQATPLLTVSVPVGLQLGPTAEGIQVQGALLQVPSRKTLGLVGGDLALVGGALVASGGRIELGSVAGPNLVSLTPVDKGWALGYKGVQNFGDIQLSQGTFVDASGLLEGAPEEMAGGDIQLQGGLVTLTDESFILADTFGNQNGGEVFIRASELGIESFSLVRALTDGLGKGGNITIESGKLRAADGGQVLTGTLDEGLGGTLTVTASDVELVGGVVAGDGGFIPSGLLSQTMNQTEGAGAAGNLMLETGRLTVQEGAQVSTTTFGAGRGGDLTVQASEIELTGNARSEDGQLVRDPLGLPIPSGLVASVEEGATGNGGTLTVATDQLRLQDGAAVQTSTLSAGDSGNLTIQASNSVELTGTARGIGFPTSIIALSGGFPSRIELPRIPEATGRAGAVNIQTGELIVEDGAAVAVSSVNETQAAQGAGTLRIQAQTVRLDKGGALEAETASGNGGDTTLQVQDLLLLRRNSNISTTAGIAGTGGNGGDININTDLLVALENSDIRANAFEGRGGNVQVNTQGYFPSLDSDITASSELGINGLVEINTPDEDLQSALTQLSANFVSPDQVVAGSCLARRNAERGSFTVTGTGGLPRSPYEAISGQYNVTGVQPIQGSGPASNHPAVVQTAFWKPGDSIQEAQGLIVTADGRTIVGTVPQLAAVVKAQDLVCSG